MNMWKQIAIAVAIAVGVFWLGRVTAPGPEVLEKTVTVTDTTEIDRLQKEVQTWQDIAQNERDTVKVYLPVPDPTSANPDGTKVYDLKHSDSNLTANIGLTVDGVLEDSEFSYYLKRTLVTERTTTITQNRTLTRTELRVEQARRPVFQNSLEAGYKINLQMEQTPYVEYKPQLRFWGINLVGTVHVAKDPYAGIGLKLNF